MRTFSIVFAVVCFGWTVTCAVLLFTAAVDPFICLCGVITGAASGLAAVLPIWWGDV